jgi:hypothetical protein
MEGRAEEKCKYELLVTRKPWSPDFALRRIHSASKFVARYHCAYVTLSRSKHTHNRNRSSWPASVVFFLFRCAFIHVIHGFI